MSKRNGKEDILKTLWKRLSENSSMDIMREILHEELKDVPWQKDIDKDIAKVVGSLSSKSYEISSELGHDEMVAYDLDDLMLKLAIQKKDTIPEETKEKIFNEWNEAVMKPPQKKKR